MSTYIAGVFDTPGSGPTDNAAVDLWLSSRFGVQPSFNTAPPSGLPDYGPVTTGATFGAPGSFTISGVTPGEYYLRAVFAGNNNWSGPYSLLSNQDVVHLIGNETVAGTKTFTSGLTASLAPLAAGRFVGFNAALGAPSAGTFLANDYCFDNTGMLFFCITGGTPGTWKSQVPAGTVNPFAGTSPPNAGWLLCDGTAVSRTSYAALFAVTGTNFGIGDGSTTFNLPDLRGRTAHGVGAVGTNTQPTLALGATGGEQNHQISTGEMAAHTHAPLVSDSPGSGNPHGWGAFAPGTGGFPGLYGTSGKPPDFYQLVALGGVTITPQNVGSNTPHNTMSPYQALNYIIKN